MKIQSYRHRRWGIQFWTFPILYYRSMTSKVFPFLSGIPFFFFFDQILVCHSYPSHLCSSVCKVDTSGTRIVETVLLNTRNGHFVRNSNRNSQCTRKCCPFALFMDLRKSSLGCHPFLWSLLLTEIQQKHFLSQESL